VPKITNPSVQFQAGGAPEKNWVAQLLGRRLVLQIVFKSLKTFWQGSTLKSARRGLQKTNLIEPMFFQHNFTPRARGALWPQGWTLTPKGWRGCRKTQRSLHGPWLTPMTKVPLLHCILCGGMCFNCRSYSTCFFENRFWPIFVSLKSSRACIRTQHTIYIHTSSSEEGPYNLSTRNGLLWSIIRWKIPQESNFGPLIVVGDYKKVFIMSNCSNLLLQSNWIGIGK
jgi:hypothetical protein